MNALHLFRDLEKRVLGDAEGAALAKWAQQLAPCVSATQFLGEAEWVILCSGISYKAARTMEGTLARTGKCAHPLKHTAIMKWRVEHVRWWTAYTEAVDDSARLAFLRTLPFMGGQALVYQLAKNLGITSFAKPDRHLIRIATEHETDPQSMCMSVASSCGVTVAYVDTVFWFAAAQRWWTPKKEKTTGSPEK